MNVVLSPYFTKHNGFSQHDSTFNCRANDFTLISRWAETLTAQRLTGMVFHNELSPSFIKEHTTKFIEFVYYDGHTRPSYNDDRFFAFRWWLRSHPEIKNVFMTDIFDVEFHGDPFALITNPEALYLGSEPRTESRQWLQRKMTETKLPALKFNKDVLYNAGIVGGNRVPVLQLLDGIIGLMRRIPPKVNANTPVYLHFTNRIWTGPIVTGFPLHNEFRSHKVNGACIKHK